MSKMNMPNGGNVEEEIISFSFPSISYTNICEALSI